MEKMNIKVILGSIREGRFGEHPARWIADLAAARPELSVELLDLKEYPMPLFADAVSPSFRQGEPSHPVVKEWEKKIREADGFIMVTPEYNRGTSGALKNAIDHTYIPWNKKVVGFVSYGSVGGTRAVEQLRSTSIELQMAPIRSAVHIPFPWNLLENGKLKEGALAPFEESAKAFLDQFIWWTRALKEARKKG
ncbi:NAD(P)H-dependent oxidoreductase [Candidatus Parcubacteria bacterium]|nr:NAD(P)H-dependent oxidoreductase [Candidatus Parcubacteria bacterium]